jgi:transposase
MLTGGQVADCTAGAKLLEKLPHCDILHGDKGYDSNAIRQQVADQGAMANIPPKANRKWKNCFSPFLYRNRNAIERMFCVPRLSAERQSWAHSSHCSVSTSVRRQARLIAIRERIPFELVTAR